MKVLVTGGAGFIGSHTVDLLIDDGYQVIIVDDLRAGKILNRETVFYQMDICSEDLVRVFEAEEPDYVIHLAAQVNVQESIIDPLTDAQINILGTVNLLDCCVKYGAKKVIFSSSAAVYGKPETLILEEQDRTVPESFYGLTKLTAENYFKMYREHYGLEYTILRYANVYGTNQLLSGEGGVVAIFIDNLLNNKTPIIYGTGEQTRDFVFVGDVARANLLALTSGDNEIINISTNTATSINDLLTEISVVVNKNCIPDYKPAKEGDLLHSVLNNNRARSLLKWMPRYSLKEGLQQTINCWNVPTTPSPKENFT